MGLIYIFDDEAGDQTLHIKSELYKYLVKVRRHCEGDEILFRSRENLQILHKYKINHIQARGIKLSLISSNKEEVKSSKSLHIAWCIIDLKSIEKILPSLCEMGVDKISFISSERSQKNFKLDFKRFNRIIEASMQQSGRSFYIEFDTYNSIKNFIYEFPDTKVFDFSDKILKNCVDFKTVLIGSEGGFSDKERELLSALEVFRLNTPMVLRSESAVMAVASKILL
ncbi:MAG: 16S rRNA (uracil(1498)-N(3))-methyltransferase [Sulfurimonas sp.]|nr:16S rRNA (uracil(1498)-N(3))-methyltransferase [Sulfurimonas sp.]